MLRKTKNESSLLKSKFIVYFLIGISSFTIYCQNDVYEHIKKLPVSDSIKSLKLDSLLEKNLRESAFKDISIVASRYANWLYNRNKVPKSLIPLKLSIQYHREDTLALQSKYRRLGTFLARLEKYDQSIIAFQKAITLNNKSSIASESHIRIADVYFKKGDFYTSTRHYDTAEELLITQKDYAKLVRCYNNSYNPYNAINTDKARKKLLSNLLKSDSICDVRTISYVSNYFSKRTLGIYYASNRSLDTIKALTYLQNALELTFKEEDSFQIREVYNDLGNLYYNFNHKKAISFYERALEYSRENGFREKTTIYSNLGLNHALLGNTTLAIDQFYKALLDLTGDDFRTLNPQQITDLLNIYYNDKNLWITLGNLSETYLLSYENTNNEKHLQEAIRYALITDKLIDIYHNNSEEEASKLVWRKRVSEVYSRTLRAYYLAQDAENALNLMEKNKALILYEENALRKQKQALNLPEAIVRRELFLKKRIQSLSKQKENTEVFKTQNELIVFQDSLQLVYPNYIKKLDSYHPKSIPEIQNNIKEDQVVVTYHINVDFGGGVYRSPHKGYGIFIAKNKTHFFEMDSLQGFEEKIDRLLHFNSAPLISTDDYQTYNKLSLEVYNTLFPKEVRTTIHDKELIIIPDNYLNKISFESLVVSEDKDTTDYLIRNHQVRYQYSYTFHSENNKINTSSTSGLAAFAPIQFTEQSLPSLNNSLSEIQNIGQYFKSNLYESQKATKQNFIDELGNTNILHLATHANANDTIAPWIAFSDEKLYLDELSLLQNNADLVVLSACNTTVGTVVKGEGVMSLARGFFYGGAKSTVSSLWQVDDKATSYIMDAFYKNLNEGQSKSKALHQAKINYLNNHNGSVLSPHYWASFILIGQNDPIPAPTPTNQIIVVLLLVIFILGIVIYYIRKSRLRKS